MKNSENPLEIVVGNSPSAAIIWLHGLGADGYDFRPIIPELGLPEHLSVRFVFPHAPVRPVTINGGMKMRAWYDISAMDLSQGEDEKGIAESAAYVETLVKREQERGIATDRIIIAGFSQGGAVSLYYLTRFSSDVAGVIALSCYLPLMRDLDREIAQSNIGIPVWMGHGSADTVVPMSLGEFSRDRLRETGFEVEWHEYAMPHSVSPSEVQDISRWLQMRLGDQEE